MTTRELIKKHMILNVNLGLAYKGKLQDKNLIRTMTTKVIYIAAYQISVWLFT